MNKKALMSLFAVALLIVMPVACVGTEGSETVNGDPYDIGGSCTGFYVGKKVSADGTTLIGQTDDSSFANVSYHTYPEITEKGRKIHGNEGFVYDIPEHTYAYTVFSSHRDDGENSSGTGGINSHGLAYTGSITAVASDVSIKADPYDKGGINEDSIGKLLCMSCDSARSAVNMLAKIIDEKGSYEGAIFMLADQEEAWYFEVYTGHQYLAIRLPEDKMATFGNEYSIIHVTEGLEYIASSGLKSLADQKGFAKYDDGKEHTIENLRIKDTYSSDNRESCHLRTWRGHNLYDSVDVGDYKDETHYPLLFTPKQNITVKNMMDFMRDRCQGTKYCPDDPGAEYHRVVGVEFTLEAHVLQIHDDLPKEMCVTYWGCMAPPEFGVYLPFNNLITEFHDAFGRTGESTISDPTTMYGIIKQIHGVCLKSKSTMKEGIRQYWDDLENYYITIYPKVLANASKLLGESREKAERYITDYSLGIQESAFEDATMLRDYCVHYLAVNATSKVMPKMSAMFDVVKYSERYGWTSEVTDKKVTLRHGDVTMVIEDTSTAQKCKCSITYKDNVYENVALYRWGDVFCLDMNSVAKVLSSYQPVIVIHERGNSSTDYTPAIIIAVFIALLAIIGVAMYARKT